MLVVLSSLHVKVELFRNLKKLHGNTNYSNVRIAHDMTRREREQEGVLWNEAKNQMEQGRGKHIVAGPPWRRRVVKVGSVTGPDYTRGTC